MSRGSPGRADVRARVAVQGASLHALTGAEPFRVPLARCTLLREGRKWLVRDEQSAVVIWSDEEGFFEALEEAPAASFREQVRRHRRAARRTRVLGWSLVALIVLFALGAASVPVTRWAVAGGVPALAGGLGDAALERLALPAGVAPAVEKQLAVLAERLRPAVSPEHRAFRVLLADYTPAHSFDLPRDTVVVTSGLVCAAEGPEQVAAAIALELAHLENDHVSARVGEAVDGDAVFALLRGDAERLRDRMLDFADASRSPGFTAEQDTAANERARVLLAEVGLAMAGQGAPPTAAVVLPSAVSGAVATDWASVRAEACEMIGE